MLIGLLPAVSFATVRMHLVSLLISVGKLEPKDVVLVKSVALKRVNH